MRGIAVDPEPRTLNPIMEESLNQFFAEQSTWALTLEIVAILAVLGRSADWLVSESVVLSERSGMPKVIVGATIVSLGTTAPEVAVSVLAALGGDPGMALGNAAGSVICDTGLILGIACLINPLSLPREIVNRQGWLQFGSGCLLVAACWPWGTGENPFRTGGNLPQMAGVLFLVLLVGYMWLSIRWAKSSRQTVDLEEYETDKRSPMPLVVAKLMLAIFLVVAASEVLIPAIKETAERLGMPSAIVAATVVAFGTSLPELVTAVTAALKKHGDLAVGNIIGADILNVLFVAGMSATVTPEGLTAIPSFFQVLFPGMLLVLVVFRVGVCLYKDTLSWHFGFVLLLVYDVLQLALFLTTPPSPAG
jgi:cation:H+ antiporter